MNLLIAVVSNTFETYSLSKDDFELRELCDLILDTIYLAQPFKYVEDDLKAGQFYSIGNYYSFIYYLYSNIIVRHL